MVTASWQCPTAEWSPLSRLVGCGSLGSSGRNYGSWSFVGQRPRSELSLQGVIDRARAPPREVFHTLVPSSAHKTSTFVSRAYDKPEINELSSVDPRVLMEPILSLHYVAEIPLSLRYTPLKSSFLLTPLRSGLVPLAP